MIYKSAYGSLPIGLVGQWKRITTTSQLELLPLCRIVKKRSIKDLDQGKSFHFQSTRQRISRLLKV